MKKIMIIKRILLLNIKQEIKNQGVGAFIMPLIQDI